MTTCTRCQLNPARPDSTFCSICWSYLAHAASLVRQGTISRDHYHAILAGNATVDFAGFPYADPAVGQDYPADGLYLCQRAA